VGGSGINSVPRPMEMENTMTKNAPRSVVLTLTPEEAKAVKSALQGRADQHRPYYGPAYDLRMDEALADLLDGVANRIP
jgi:hypothetical protein